METHNNNKLRSLMVGIASMMSTLFLISPPFERNPQQCEMVQTIGRKGSGRMGDEDPLKG